MVIVAKPGWLNGEGAKQNAHEQLIRGSKREKERGDKEIVFLIELVQSFIEPL